MLPHVFMLLGFSAGPVEAVVSTAAGARKRKVYPVRLGDRTYWAEDYREELLIRQHFTPEILPTPPPDRLPRIVLKNIKRVARPIPVDFSDRDKELAYMLLEEAERMDEEDFIVMMLSQ